ncbi:MAG: CRISPR-associated endonuclease Cas2 [Lentilitoribacter sp.]
MGSKNRLQIFTYDITQDSNRRKIARALEEKATRVQFSVFEARLTPQATKKLVKQLSKHLEKGDSLRVYTVGKIGERHCQVIGDGIPVENETGFWLL